MTAYDVPVFPVGNPKHGDIVRVDAPDPEAAKAAALAQADADDGIDGAVEQLEAGAPVEVDE